VGLGASLDDALALAPSPAAAHCDITRKVITHVVGWTFKSDVAEAAAQEQNEGIARRGEIPEVRSWVFGQTLRGATTSTPFHFGYVATFDSIDALARFEQHPIYKPFSTSLAPLVEPIVVMDLSAEGFDSPPAGRRSLRHVVMWSFKEETSVDETRRILAKVERSRQLPQVRALGFGPNLGRSLRPMGHTHLGVWTFDDAGAMEEFAKQPDRPALQREESLARLTVLDIEG
jgi:hypothetical protein